MATALPDMNLDLENTDDLNKSFAPVKNGNYTLTITKAPTAKLSQPSPKNPDGAWMLMLEYAVDNPETGNTQKIWDNLVFTQKSLFKVRQWLLSLGFEGNMNASALLEDDFRESLVGREVTADVVIKAQEYPAGSKNYVQKNVVASYTSDEVPSRNTASSASSSEASSGDLDDIPF